jgi:hypothetical protein
MSFETTKLPEVKFNKNGYEIRTDILGMAKSLVQDDFHAKFQGWEMSAAKDEKNWPDRYYGRYATISRT